MLKVMKYEHGVLLANYDGAHRKTQKSKLFKHLESHYPDAGNVPENLLKIFYGVRSDYLLKKILYGCSRVACFVTDFYLKDSVKSMERDRRSASGSLHVKVMRRDQAVPKQFSKFLKNAENKLDLLDFLVKDWSTNEFHFERLDGKELYFTIRDQAVCVSSNQER